jgi:mannose-6-phosphate isomerase-like protein (cupin superfamily)
MPATFTTQGEQPSQSLHYLLVPEAQAGRSITVKTGEISEIYKNQEPITWSPDKEQVLSLAQLSLPPAAPKTAPHSRTGAALYYVLAGTGQFTSHGKTEDKPPGSVIYEPSGLVHQWANPGTEPLTLIVANIAPHGEPNIRLSTAQAEEGTAQ